jgi:hypothetical protein
MNAEMVSREKKYSLGREKYFPRQGAKNSARRHEKAKYKANYIVRYFRKHSSTLEV